MCHFSLLPARNEAARTIALAWHNPTSFHVPHIPTGTHRSSDFTDPLEPYENPSPSLLGVLRWLPTTFAPFLPPGMRHTTMPRAGALAR